MPFPSHCVQIDPFLGRYYASRSAESIAEEIAAHGFNGIQMIVTRDSRVHGEVLNALRRRKIHVDYTTFGNGTYDTHDLPDGWQEWCMVTRQPMNDGYTRLCLNHPEYRRWKKAQISDVLRRYPFDGVHIMESFWPEYPGPTSPAYACLCERCRSLFAQKYSGAQPPEFQDESRSRFWLRQPDLYAKWVEFRVQSHTEFLSDLLNGEGGIRKTHPRIPVTVWILAIDVPDPVRFVREVHGQDIAEVVRQARPDAICLQTHWHDWIKAELAPRYVRAYQPLVQAARSAKRGLPIMIQADIGSQPQNRRSWQWIDQLREACKAIGVQSTTLYEYTLGLYMYTEPPRVVKTMRTGKNSALLVFNKRLDARTAGEKSRYIFTPPLQIDHVEVDGNLVHLHTAPMRAGQRYRLSIQDVSDDPSARWLPETATLTLQEQTVTL
ncbi:MAG: hypothetical protein KatS3mg022_1861 [Armatimonadota bacterium]|nr:MAG: hypothetical protein KatS3mg022_1861 [Armatimonadota bacterium]